MENLKPRTLGGVRGLMSLLGVYRRRTKNFVQINSKTRLWSPSSWPTEEKGCYLNQAEPRAT